MTTPSFLTNVKQEKINAGELTEIATKVKAYREILSNIEAATKELAALNKEAQRLGQEEIPMLLLQHDVSELRMGDGAKIIIKENVSCSIPPEKRTSFFEFLEKRGESDIVKLQLQFKKMPQQKLNELFDFLNGYEYDFESERGVHPQTLKKYIKDLLGLDKEKEVRTEGIANGTYLRKADLENVVNVYTFFTTNVKE
jgi:hypothetical protein